MKKNSLILIVEDDDGHAYLIEKNLKRIGITNQIQRFGNGDEFIKYLQNGLLDQHFDKEYQLIIFLDIRMPKMDGISVLKIIKKHPNWKRIPVIMLTSTEDPKEIDECYELGCNMYITKPVDYEKLTKIVEQLGVFIEIVNIPRINIK